MCGVAGFVTTTPDSGSVAHLGRMTEALRHRGPDDFGYYHDQFAHLGHRRLSIVDVAGGRQPMVDEARSLAIVYNGEIYNHAELRPALENAGHRYRTRSDTETILHAYQEHGADCRNCSGGYSPSPSGMAGSGVYSARAIGWESSLSITTGTGKSGTDR